MAQNFVACDREQELLLPPRLREWLPEGHLAWFVIDAVPAFDLSGFYAAYRADGHERPRYELTQHPPCAAARGAGDPNAVDACRECLRTRWRCGGNDSETSPERRCAQSLEPLLRSALRSLRAERRSFRAASVHGLARLRGRRHGCR